MHHLWRPLALVTGFSLITVVAYLHLFSSSPQTQRREDFWRSARDIQNLFLPSSELWQVDNEMQQHKRLDLQQQKQEKQKQKQQQQQQQQKQNPQQQQQQQQQQQKCRKLRLWPSGLDETEDRILDQLQYTVPQPKEPKRSTHVGTNIPSHMKIIQYDYTTRHTEGHQQFAQCPVSNCFLTKVHAHRPIADAVLFAWYVPQAGRFHQKYQRPLKQRWVVLNIEPPSIIPHLSTDNVVNYTVTYRMDSTIVTPYAYFVPFPDASVYQTMPPKQNYAAGKNKSVVWFVSNCKSANNRMGYAQELAKHIDVDIYGGCGNMSCKKQCWEMLDKVYRYYLAFENTNCKDYITEKFFRNGLQHSVIPIVMGAPPEYYHKVAPLNSYIHVDDFESPKELAAFLHKLNNDDHLYNNYFRWKGSGEFIDTKFWCRLCALVNDDSITTWYEDVNYWWRGPGICVHPSPENPFASWRLAQKQSSHNVSENDHLFDPQYVYHTVNASTQHQCN